MGCCSGSTFTTAPDADIEASQRVNYTFGMVLGVDDFKQEHAWLAGRDERALRETIGYGVVSGLDVTVQPGDEAGAVEVRVSPGLAIAPDGKMIAVASAQCARLDTWLSGPGLQKPVVAGSRLAYVVLAYAEQTGTPVPIPGEPCRDESSLQADSRIADSFKLELRWDAPSSEEDDALREFVAWLRRIEVQDHPAHAVSITEFQTAVEQGIGQALSGPYAPPTSPPAQWGSPPESLVIPREQYTQYISAAFDVWVRRLRLQHLAKHGPVQVAEGKGTPEHAIVLGTVHCELSPLGLLVPTGSPPAPASVDALGRPQLLHLRMLQEWLLSNVENDAPREAHYVLGKADPRLPNAQNLHATFFGARGREPIERERAHGPMARVDEVSRDKAKVVPAQVWDGSSGDYYSPHMDAPILVSDGGTGQSTAPGNGQILVGHQGVFALADVLGANSGQNITVSHAAAAPHNVVLDTVQPINSAATPQFAGLTLTGLGGALLAADAQDKVIQALPWDGAALGLPRYYAPGQAKAVRIQDGGTGLQALPKPMQMLIGSNEDIRTRDYVLATIQGGKNVTVTLVPVEASPPSPGPRGVKEWALTIDADSALSLPVLPTQGGTGLITPPTAGQLLIGGNGGTFTLGQLAGTNGGRNITVSSSAGAVSVNTVQDLHKDAIPTFQDLLLTKPSETPATHNLGWNRDTQEVVIGPNGPNGSDRRKVRIVIKPTDADVQDSDEVLVVRSEKEVAFKLKDPPTDQDNGRVLVIKSANNSTANAIVIVTPTDLGDLALKPHESVTLIASVALKQWLVIGRS